MSTNLIIQPAIINTDDPDILKTLVDAGYINPDNFDEHTPVLNTEDLFDKLDNTPRINRTLGERKLLDILEDIVYEHHIPEVIIYQVFSCISPYLLEE